MTSPRFRAPLLWTAALIICAANSGVASDAVTITLGVPFVIEQATGTELRQFPFVYAAPATANSDGKRQVFVGYSQHLDSGSATPKPGARVSHDGGKTFLERLEGVPFINAFQRADGTMISVDFRTRRKANGDGKRFEMDYRESSDGGKTWQPGVGELVAPEAAKSFYFHRGIIAARDGALLVPGYGAYADDKLSRAMLARSADGGKNWKIISTIATSAAPSLAAAAKTRKPAGPNETTVERCADGSLLAVFRTGGNYPLHQCRSRDDGVSWSEPVQLSSLSESESVGVDPHLVRMSNGVLVLAYGRPGMRVTVSVDGNGEAWSHLTNVFDGEKTSGYPSIVEVGPNRLLLVGDTGANWQYKLQPFPNPNPFSIWGRFVEIRRQ